MRRYSREHATHEAGLVNGDDLLPHSDHFIGQSVWYRFVHDWWYQQNSCWLRMICVANRLPLSVCSIL